VRLCLSLFCSGVRTQDRHSILKHSTRLPVDTAAHLQVLEALDGAGHVSQRAVAETVGMAASRVNRIINALAGLGHVAVSDGTVRPYAYRLTSTGRAYLQELSYDHFASVVGRFRQVEARIRSRLAELRDAGAENVVFYGAGDVMEVAYPLAQRLGLRVVGVVDDDPSKHSNKRGITVGPPASIGELAPDAVVITTFRHTDEIRSRVRPFAPSALRVIAL
jgi:DNA-binding MarR family transcriptional regulator